MAFNVTNNSLFIGTGPMVGIAAPAALSPFQTGEVGFHLSQALDLTASAGKLSSGLSLFMPEAPEYFHVAAGSFQEEGRSGGFRRLQAEAGTTVTGGSSERNDVYQLVIDKRDRNRYQYLLKVLGTLRRLQLPAAKAILDQMSRPGKSTATLDIPIAVQFMEVFAHLSASRYPGAAEVWQQLDTESKQKDRVKFVPGTDDAPARIEIDILKRLDFGNRALKQILTDMLHLDTSTSNAHEALSMITFPKNIKEEFVVTVPATRRFERIASHLAAARYPAAHEALKYIGKLPPEEPASLQPERQTPKALPTRSLLASTPDQNWKRTGKFDLTLSVRAMRTYLKYRRALQLLTVSGIHAISQGEGYKSIMRAEIPVTAEFLNIFQLLAAECYPGALDVVKSFREEIPATPSEGGVVPAPAGSELTFVVSGRAHRNDRILMRILPTLVANFVPGAGKALKIITSPGNNNSITLSVPISAEMLDVVVDLADLGVPGAKAAREEMQKKIDDALVASVIETPEGSHIELAFALSKYAIHNRSANDTLLLLHTLNYKGATSLLYKLQRRKFTPDEKETIAIPVEPRHGDLIKLLAEQLPGLERASELLKKHPAATSKASAAEDYEVKLEALNVSVARLRLETTGWIKLMTEKVNEVRRDIEQVEALINSRTKNPAKPQLLETLSATKSAFNEVIGQYIVRALQRRLGDVKRVQRQVSIIQLIAARFDKTVPEILSLYDEAHDAIERLYSSREVVGSPEAIRQVRAMSEAFDVEYIEFTNQMRAAGLLDSDPTSFTGASNFVDAGEVGGYSRRIAPRATMDGDER